LLLFAIPLSIYAQSLGNYFVAWDDNILVYNNPLVLHFSPYALWAVFTSYDPELYIPLTFLSYQIEHLVFGLNATVFHTTNLLLHCGSGVMIFFLLQRWRITRSVAFVLALIFAVHPMNSEAVAWVSARKDTLSSFFFLATLLQWEGYRADATKKKYWIAVLFFLIALLSKVSIALLPIVLLLIDWRDGRTIHRKAILEKLPFFVLSGIFIVVALFGKTSNIATLTIVQTALMICKAIAFYTVTYLFPLHISSIYQQSTPITILSTEFAIPALFVLLLILTIIVSLRSTRLIAFSVLFFLVMLLPAFANFTKAGGIYFAADRYIYMAQIGGLYLLGRGWMHAQKVSCARMINLVTAAVLVVFLPTYAWASYERSILWGDSETLFRDALEKNPGSPMIHFNLGVLEQRHGDIAEARALYTKARELRSDYSPAYNNEGLILWELGEKQKAEEWFEAAVHYDPHNLSAVINLAMAQIERGDADSAIILLQQALREDPYNVQALIKLGAAYGKKEMYHEGLEAFQKAWKLDPVMHEQSKELEKVLLELDENNS
jgi:tetratricopeptide (TPR) repeat protein